MSCDPTVELRIRVPNDFLMPVAKVRQAFSYFSVPAVATKTAGNEWYVTLSGLEEDALKRLEHFAKATCYDYEVVRFKPMEKVRVIDSKNFRKQGELANVWGRNRSVVLDEDTHPTVLLNFPQVVAAERPRVSWEDIIAEGYSKKWVPGLELPALTSGD